MKYLNKRDEFLKELRSIKSEDITRINEAVDMMGSGPFSNDTPWGDTLVGRLVNSIRRKIGIGVNLVRIQPLILRLKSEFSNIKQYADAAELSEEDKKKVAMVIVCILIRYIKLAIVDKSSVGTPEDVDIENIEIPDDSKMSKIEDETYLVEVENIIDDTMVQIGEITDQFGSFEGEDELISELRDIQKKVKELKSKLKKEGGEEKGKEKGEGLPKGFSVSANNAFKSLAQIIIEYKKMRDAKAAEFKGKQVAGKEVGKEVPGEEIAKGKEVPTENIQKSREEQLQPQTDSYRYINEAAVASPILAPLKSMYDTFLQIEPDTLKDLDMFLKKSEEGQLTPEFSDPIVRMFKNVVGIKEDINMLLSNDRKLSEAIKAFYNVSKTKPDGSFEGISDGMKMAIAKFNTSMTALVGTLQEKESKLLKYGSFRKIFEAEGDEKTDNKDEKVDVNTDEVTYSNQQSILSAYWEEKWTSKISKIIYTEVQWKKTVKELEKLKTETKEAIVIDGMDPVIAIVKLFNRAYKLYTVNAIPGGRSGGKISRGVANEYTPVGGGSFGSGENLSGTSGPYRNNRIFNSWENAVLDIMRDREYQPIFNKKTQLRVGNELVEGAGTILKKFMNELLDGSKLYGGGDRSDGKGAQYEFIQKYFGEEAAKEVEGNGFYIKKEDEKETQEMAEKVKEAATTLNFEEPRGLPDITKIKEQLVGTIVRVECEMVKEGEEEEKNPEKLTKKRYFYVIEGDNDRVYLVHSRTFGNLNQYVKNDFKKKASEVSYKDSTFNAETKEDVYLTWMKPSKFLEMLKPGSSVQLVGHQPNADTVTIGKQKTVKVKWLCKLKSDNTDPESRYQIENYSFADAKGFAKDALKTKSRETTITR